jgi:hypothetical protein
MNFRSSITIPAADLCTVVDHTPKNLVFFVDLIGELGVLVACLLKQGLSLLNPSLTL